MAKYNLEWDEAKLKRFIKEGRGQGEGKDYKPWLTTYDFSSKGRSSRLYGIKTGRIHHLFTDSETRYFFLLQWEDAVIDIREHYPLLDFDDVVQERDDLKWELFTDKRSGTRYVISTSFLITLKDNGKITYAARSLKAASELEKKISLERLEIERRYWEAKGIDWGIVTNRDIPTVKAKNIEWVLSSLYSYNDVGLTKNDLAELGTAFLYRLSESSKSIRSITLDFDRDYNLDAGTGLFLFRYLIASKKIKVDMDRPIDLNNSAQTIVIANTDFEEGWNFAGG